MLHFSALLALGVTLSRSPAPPPTLGAAEATSLAEAGNWDELLVKFLSAQPGGYSADDRTAIAEALLQGARALRETDVVAAVTLAEKSGSFEESVEAWLLAGELNQQLELIDQASKEYHQALALDPASDLGHLLSAELELAEGHAPMALLHLQSIAPRFEAARVKRAADQAKAAMAEAPKPDAAGDVPATLLVITSNLLAFSLRPLVEHKNLTGMPTQLLTVSEIRGTASGADDPERIKRTIASYVQSHGTRYVLLGGDPSQVPTRHRAVIGADHRTVLSYNFTDHYYSNLWKGHSSDGTHSGELDTWDGDGDGRFNTEFWDAESADLANPDHVDGYPDVSVGRIPVNTTEAMDQFVAKVIAYESESNPDSEPGVRATLVQDEGYPGAGVAALGIERSLRWNRVGNRHLVINHSGAAHEPWTAASSREVITSATESSLVFYIGHSGPRQWDHVVSSAEVNRLSNTDYPIVFAAGCESAQFAPMDLFPSGPPDDTASQSLSLGATWAAPAGGGGAIAYIGETVGMPDSPSVALATSFARFIASDVRILGDAWHLAQVEYWKSQPRHNILGAPRIFLSIEALLGDPSLRLRWRRTAPEGSSDSETGPRAQGSDRR